MSDWELIIYALNWHDKSGFQRDCFGLAVVFFVVLVFVLFFAAWGN